MELQKYRIEVKSSNKVWNELYACDGTDDYVIKETACLVPISAFALRPHAINPGDKFSIRVIAITDKGETVLAAVKSEIHKPKFDPDNDNSKIVKPTYKKPSISSEIEFEAIDHTDWQYVWPTEDDLLELPVLTDFRLSKIRYRQANT